MKKSKINIELGKRYQMLNDMYEAHKDVYGLTVTRKNYKKLQKLADDFSIKDKKDWKDGVYELDFCHQLLRYTDTLISQGKYFSHNFLKSIRPFPYSIHTHAKLLHATKKIGVPIDTLMGFTILRSWLEEITLNLFFFYKSTELIKLKKWSDLFILIHKINYYGYEDEMSFYIRSKGIKFKKYLGTILKKDKKLHISDLIKYVISQKDLVDIIDKDKLSDELIKSKIPINHKIILRNLASRDTTYSMKPIKEFYDKLSVQLHPNNFLHRNTLVDYVHKRNTPLFNYIKTNRHLKLISECHDFIVETSEILFKKTIELNSFFISNLENKNFSLSFRNSVRNSVFKK